MRQAGEPAGESPGGGHGPALGQSLRAAQVTQTRAALISAGRHLFGSRGFAETSVTDLASEARVTTGALYHHFPTKTALFEAVFEQVHAELIRASARVAGAGGAGGVGALARGIEAFLDGVLEPGTQRILVTDAPAVLGLTRFIELDERYAVAAIASDLRAAAAEGELRAADPETLARLLLGALTRGAMLIASSSEPGRARDAVARNMRALLAGLAPGGGTAEPPRHAGR